MEGRCVLHEELPLVGRYLLGATPIAAAHTRRRDREFWLSRWVEQVLDVNDGVDDLHLWLGGVALLDQLHERGEACDVSILQGERNSACELVAIEVRVAHRKKGDVNVIEDAALKKPRQVAEKNGVLVLSNAVVQLQVECWGQSTAFFLFRQESPVQHLASHVGIGREVLVREEDLRVASVNACDFDVDLQAFPKRFVLLGTLLEVWEALRELARTLSCVECHV